MANKERVTRMLLEIGACWAVMSDKFCDPNDPFEDQIAGTKTYHIHPDRLFPQQDDIIRFNSLDEVGRWVKALAEAKAERDGAKACDIMQDFWDSVN